MGLGVLEPKGDVHTPGTVVLNEAAAGDLGSLGHALKHDTGKNSDIILAPQPSSDPNDPLNWSWTQKHLVLLILCLGSTVNAACLGPLLTAAIVQVSKDLNTSFTSIVLLSGYQLLIAGAFGPIVSAVARKVGKRPCYIFSSLMGVVGCLIGEFAHKYTTLVASRLVQGLASSAYESLILASIGDLFFVHQRGVRVGAVMFILTAISNGTSVIAGPIAAHLGWPYNFHILQPFVVLQFLLVVFFVPETTYLRNQAHDTDITGYMVDPKELRISEEHTEGDSKGAVAEIERKNTNDIIERITTTDTHPPRKKSWLQSLSIYNGIFIHDSIFKMLLAPLVVLLNVGILYNVLVSGLVVAWYVAASVVSSVALSSPPYLFTSAGVGYAAVGPLVGGTLASIFMALSSDPWIKWMSKKNRGVYEPEFRLPVMVVGAILLLCGLLGFGYSIHNTVSVYIICFTWGVMLFGITVIATLTATYALDAFREYSTEIFIMNMFFKNFFYYGLTNYIVDWYFSMGAAKVFGIMAGLSVVICLTTLPLYIYGKRYRAFWHRNNLIKIFRLETDKSGFEE